MLSVEIPHSLVLYINGQKKNLLREKNLGPFTKKSEWIFESHFGDLENFLSYFYKLNSKYPWLPKCDQCKTGVL